MKQSVFALAFAVATGVCAVLGAPAAASAPPNAIAVLGVEKQWIAAIATRNAGALGKILAPNFVHVNYRGALRYREDELADVKKPKSYRQTTSEQTVDFFGSVAIVHGVNTISEKGKTLLRLRYTDVYAKEDGAWRAVSAQETPFAKP